MPGMPALPDSRFIVHISKRTTIATVL